jgi:hypothetical protein
MPNETKSQWEAARAALAVTPRTEAELVTALRATVAVARLISAQLSAYKVCSCCGRVFETRADFTKLPLCGRGYQPQYTEAGDEHPSIRLELRNCTTCHSTLSVEVPVPAGNDDDEPCETCGLLNAHDEDVHAEARLDAEDKRAWAEVMF